MIKNKVLIAIMFSLFLLPMAMAFDVYEFSYANSTQFGVGSSQSIAQTFTVGSVGENTTFIIKQVRMSLASIVTPLDFSIEIQYTNPSTFEPNGTIITQNTTIDNSVVNSNSTFKFLYFDIPEAVLEAGERYALVLRYNSGGQMNWQGISGNFYPGGEYFYANPPSSDNWVTQNRDFVFEILGDNYTGIPMPSIISPQNISYSNATIDLEVTDDGVIDNWWYTNDSGATNYSFTPNITRDWNEGGNTVTVYANNTNGIGEATVTFYVDSINPIVNIWYPTATTYEENITEINYTASNGGALDSCWYSLDDGATNSSTQVCNTNWTGLDIGNGTYTLTIYANDSVGLEGFGTVTFTITYPPITPVYNESTPQFENEIILLDDDLGIYRLMRTSGAGLSLFMTFVSQSLPVILIILFVVTAVIVIGIGLASAIKLTGFKNLKI
jgi:hypothetical protein